MAQLWLCCRLGTASETSVSPRLLLAPLSRLVCWWWRRLPRGVWSLQGSQGMLSAEGMSVLGGVWHLMLVLVQVGFGVARVAVEMKYSVSHRLCHPGVSRLGGQVTEMSGAKYVLWVLKIPVDSSENIFHKMSCDVLGLAVAGETGAVYL